MSGEIDDGGPAFPEVFTDGPNERRDHADIYSAGGMTLRDYFAARAMDLFADEFKYWFRQEGDKCGQVIGMTHIGEKCYRVADAMIAARKGKS